MFYIIDNKEDLSSLPLDNTCFIYPILNDNRIHPISSSLISLYILYPNNKSYIINISHPDYEGLFLRDIFDFISKFNNIYVFDKKLILYFFPKLNKKLVDIGLYYYLNNKKLNLNLKLYDIFYSKYSQQSDINNIIPLCKHFEIIESNKQLVDLTVDYSSTPGYEFYINKLIPTFFLLEKQGIININNEAEYGVFNLYTLAGRPSFTFNNVNYLALTQLSKGNYKPLNDYFFEFDYSSYHLFLLSKLINYTFPEDNPHKYLAKFYFPNQEITEDLYKQSKQITFRLLYGENNEWDIEFFNRVKKLTQTLHKEYLEKGYISSFLSGKHIFIESENNLSSSKILNYYIQAFETEYNVLNIKKIFNLLKNKKSKLILYIFDAFLLDYSNEDGKHTLKEIKEILTNNNKFSLKIKYGKNLGELKTI